MKLDIQINMEFLRPIQILVSLTIKVLSMILKAVSSSVHDSVPAYHMATILWQ